MNPETNIKPRKDAILSSRFETLSLRQPSLLSAADGQRLFLTGGTGFFGKWLLNLILCFREHLGLNTSLTVLSRDPSRFLSEYPEYSNREGLTFIRGDVRSFAFPAGHYSWVIHAATDVNSVMERERPSDLYSVITHGTQRLLDFANHCGAERFLYISSGAVYGLQPINMSHIPEDYDGEPSTTYGKGKKASELLCVAASSRRLSCTIARPFAFVGPHLPLDTHFAIGNFIRDCVANKPIIIRGDGTPLRTYLYAADLAEWLIGILVRGQPGRAYNVGSEAMISIRDLATLVRARAGTHNDITVEGEARTGVPPHRYVPSTERARNELGLSQQVTLECAIDRTLDWARHSL